MTGLDIQRSATILYCRRWRQTVGFYRDVIGLPVTLEKPWFVEFTLNGSARLAVADARRATVASSGGAGLTLSWQVENVLAVHRRMADAGVSVTAVRNIWGAKAFFVFDPEGNRIEIWC